MMVVKGFFWNYRGIKKMLPPYVREMLRSLNPEFACFQETILSDFSEACLRKIDPGKCYLWDWIPAKGKSGGVLTGLKVERFDVGVRRQGGLFFIT
jgi:hypothetical protein